MPIGFLRSVNYQGTSPVAVANFRPARRAAGGRLGARPARPPGAAGAGLVGHFLTKTTVHSGHSPVNPVYDGHADFFPSSTCTHLVRPEC
jgi:hypothetical protein